MIIRVRDILELIAEGEVHQRRRLKNAGWSYAHSRTSTRPDEILIARDQTRRQKVDTLVHEAVHLYSARHELDFEERDIIKHTKIIMRRMYG